MGKPLSFNLWAVKWTYRDQDGVLQTRLLQITHSRQSARNCRQFEERHAIHEHGSRHRYTVVPVVVRERR